MLSEASDGSMRKAVPMAMPTTYLQGRKDTPTKDASDELTQNTDLIKYLSPMISGSFKF